MAKKFYTDINLKKNELQNAAIENLAAAPSDPVLGQLYFNTTDNEIYVCVDAAAPTWESMGGDIESVTAGAGLTGGGTDGAVTLDIGQGTGITVNADEIKLKNADSLTDDTVVKWDDTNGQLVDTVITDDGTNVGINNTSPSVELDVTGDTKFSGDSDFLNGNYITKSLPSFSMGAGGVNDEYLVICKQVVAIPAVEELGEGESQSDYYQDATGVTGRIYFSRGSAGSFNNNGYIDIVAQVSKDSGNVNNFDLSEFKIVGDSLFFTQIEEIDIDGTKYLALKARASGGGSVNHFFFVGNLSDDGADTNILTRVRASDSTVTVTDPQPSGFPIAPYMRQDEDGNVGIGTGTPSDKLDVHGIIAVDGAALIDKSNNTVTIGDVDGVDEIGFLDINTADASTRIFLNDSGNVGIGTATPLSWARLHVNGTIHSPSLITTDDKLRVRGAGQSDAVIIDGAGDTYFNGGDVGIGTTSPAYKLDVNGNLRVSNEIIGDSYIRTNGGNVVRSQYDTDNYSELESNGTGGLMSAKSGGTVKLYLSSYQDSYFTGGKVLIGTASSIHGSADLQIVGATGNYARIAMKDSDGTNQLAFIDEIEGSLNFTSQNGTSNGTIKFIGFNGAASSTSMIVAADGNVGIGTTSPSVKFEVAGFARLTGSLQLAGNNRYIYAINDTSLLLGTNNTERMRITNTGNVGIGTTSPGYKLDINGSVNIASAQPLRWGSGDVEIINSGYNLVFKTYDGTDSLDEHMRITSSGDVGIGTTSPNAKLDVNNSAVGEYAYFGSGSTRQLRLSSYNTVSDHAGHKINASSGNGEITLATNSIAALTVKNDQTIQLNAYGTGYLKSDASGNITVDSDTIEDTLDSVTDRGNTTTNNITVGNITSTSGVVTIGQNKIDGSSDNLKIMSDSESISGSSTIEFSVDGSEKMRIAHTGNVGIGTTDPGTNARLKVAGSGIDIESSTDSLRLRFYEGDTFRSGIQHVLNTGEMISNSAVGDLAVRANAGNMLFATGSSTERMRIDSSGNVGIGTTNPTRTLHVAGTGRFTDNLYSTSTDVDGIKTRFLSGAANNSTNNGTLYLQYGKSNPVSIGETGSSDLYVAGNVGIGTTSPADKLHVSVSSGNYQIDGDSSGNIYHKSQSGEHRFRADGGTTNAFTIANNLISTLKTAYFSSNVGIGTASPSEKLHVVGNVRIEGDLTVNGSYTQIDTDVNTTEQWNVTNDGTGPAVTINQTGAQDIMDVQDDGTSVFYIEDGGNVGLGTTNPTTTLDVRGDVMVESENTPTVSVRDTTNNLVGRLRAANSFVYLTADHGDTVSSSRIVFQVDGDSSAYVTNGLFAAETSVQFTTYGSGTETGTAAYALAVDSSGNVIETAVQGSPTGGSGTAGKLTKWDTSSTLTDSVITESSGNIGIGTTSPSHTLDVNGELRVGTVVPQTSADFSVRRNGANIEFGHGNRTSGYYGTIGVQGNNGMPYIALSADCESSVNTFTTRGFKGNVITTDGAGSLMFSQLTTANATGQSLTERMRINNAGNVGIGTTSPAYKLDVNGTAHYTGNVLLDDNVELRLGTSSDFKIGHTGSYTYMYNYTGHMYLRNFANDSDIVFQTDDGAGGYESYFTLDGSTGHAYFSNYGNVGIGTTSPEEALHIHQLGSDTRIQIITDPTRSSTIFFGDTDDRNVGALAYDNNGDFMTFGVNAAERMRITSSGNVGIGTTSPSSKLEVNGGSSYPDIRISATGLTSRYMEFGMDSAVQHSIGAFGTGSYLTFKTAGTDKVAIDASGNVGIGTTSPVKKLQVHGAVYSNIGLYSDHSYSSNRNWSIDTNAFGSGNWGGLAIKTSTGVGLDPSTTRFGIDYLGNVGIGTTSPSAKLDVEDSGADLIDLTRTSVGTYRLAISGNDRFSIYDVGESSERLSITSTGNVGIGTTSPSEKLEVNGNVKADNFIGGNDAGIYTFNDTVDASSSEDIFSISNEHGAQAFRVTFVCSTTSYSVAKTFEVVHAFGTDPVFFKVVDTGAFGNHDFDASFATEAGGLTNNNKKIICTITNNSTTINADIVTTVFLGGSPTAITVTAL